MYNAAAKMIDMINIIRSLLFSELFKYIFFGEGGYCQEYLNMVLDPFSLYSSLTGSISDALIDCVVIIYDDMCDEQNSF